MSNVMEIERLTKRYGTTPVLEDVSAIVPSGEVVGLLGHNGAGKTTLIKIALGLVRATAGEMRLFGSRVEGADPRSLHRCVGYLPENVAFYGNLTGQEVLAYLARLKGAPARDSDSLLRRVGLQTAKGKCVRDYSKGMRQRLGLAQALLGSPELLFLDEPTSGLDPLATQEFYGLIRELKAAGNTVVISSHLLAELESHIDSAVILRHGRVVAQGTLAQMQRTAGLPVSIHARVSGKLHGLLHEPWAAGLPSTPRLLDEQCFCLEVPPVRKVDVLRQLMRAPGLCDVTVREPGLARLYAAIGEEGREEGPEDA